MPGKVEIWWKTLIVGILIGIVLTIILWVYWEHPSIEPIQYDHVTYVKEMRRRSQERETYFTRR